MIMRLFSRFSGFGDIAAHYATPGPATGELQIKQTLQIGAVRWRKCADMVIFLPFFFPEFPPGSWPV